MDLMFWAEANHNVLVAVVQMGFHNEERQGELFQRTYKAILPSRGSIGAR